MSPRVDIGNFMTPNAYKQIAQHKFTESRNLNLSPAQSASQLNSQNQVFASLMKTNQNNIGNVIINNNNPQQKNLPFKKSIDALNTQKNIYLREFKNKSNKNVQNNQLQPRKKQSQSQLTGKSNNQSPLFLQTHNQQSHKNIARPFEIEVKQQYNKYSRTKYSLDLNQQQLQQLQQHKNSTPQPNYQNNQGFAQVSNRYKYSKFQNNNQNQIDQFNLDNKEDQSKQNNIKSQLPMQLNKNTKLFEQKVKQVSIQDEQQNLQTIQFETNKTQNKDFKVYQPRQQILPKEQSLQILKLNKVQSVTNLMSSQSQSRRTSKNSVGERSLHFRLSEHATSGQDLVSSHNGNQEFKSSSNSLNQAKWSYLRKTTLQTSGFMGGGLRTMKTNREALTRKLELQEKIQNIKAKFERNHSLNESNKSSDSFGSIVTSTDSQADDSKTDKIQRQITKKTNQQENRRRSNMPDRRRQSTVMPLSPTLTQHKIENLIFESVFSNDIGQLRGIISNITNISDKYKQLNVIDSQMRTPLFYAVFHDNYEISSYLISQGADTLFIDQEGRTVLHYASIFSSNRQLVQLILDYNNQMDIDNTHSQEGLKVFAVRKKNDYDIPQRGAMKPRPQLQIDVNMFSGKKMDDHHLQKQPFEKIYVDNIQQPMTSLMPKKNRILDVSKLSVIKDDVSAESSVQNASSSIRDQQKQTSTFANLKQQNLGLGNPLQNQLLMKRQQSKRTGLPRSGSTIGHNSAQTIKESGKKSSLSSQLAEERGKFNLEVQIKRTKNYQVQAQKFINVTDKLGKTALFYACQKGKLPIVKLLVERGAIPITRDHMNRKPIDVAQTQDIYNLISQQESIFEEKFSNSLKSHRKSVILDDFDKLRTKKIQQTSKNFRKPIHEEIKELKTEDDLESLAEKQRTYSPLTKKSKDLGMRISKKYQLNKIELSSWSDKLLLRYHLGIYKDNVLTYKMRFSDKDNFEYLLQRNLSVLYANKDGNNLIHYAIQLDKIEFLCYLLEGTFESELYERSLRIQEDSLYDLYAHQQAKDIHDRIESGQYPWILDALYALEKANEKEGNTSLQMAIDVGNLQLFCYILTIMKIRDYLVIKNETQYSHHFKSFQSQLEFKNKHQQTPLLYSAKRNQFKMFQILLMQGAEIYTQCSKLMNILHYAVLNENQSMVEQIVYCDAETDRLLNEKNFRNQTPIMLDDKKKFTHIFNHIWMVSSICTPQNMEQLDYLIQNDKFQVNQRTLIGQNVPLHFAVMNENFKAIEYLCKYQDINLYERNSLGQTPRDIALLLPKRRTAFKIIDFFNRKIQFQNVKDKGSLSPSFRSGNKRQSFIKKSGLSRQGTKNFTIIPKQTESKKGSSPITQFISINFDCQIRQFIDQMGKVMIGMERSNSIMGKKQSTNSVDSSEKSDDLFEEESSFASNMYLASQVSILDNDQRGGINNRSNQNQYWEPLKIQKLIRIYDNFLEHSDKIGNFNPQIFMKWKQQIQRLDENIQQKIKEIFQQYDEKRKGVIRVDLILKNKEPIIQSGIYNDNQFQKFINLITKDYSNSKITETIFVKLINLYIHEKSNSTNNNVIYNTNSSSQNNNSNLKTEQ